MIPAVKADEKEKHQGRQFQIRYDFSQDNYLVKDLGIGYGVFTESIGAIPLRDNQLINMGESYMVTNLVTATEEEEFDFNEGNPISKVKLRVFSVSKSDTPDLYSFVDPEQELIIGRSPNCDIRIDDELLSKMQSTIAFDRDQQQWCITDGYKDKPSTNGTWIYLNEEVPIHSGMLLKSNQTFFQANLYDADGKETRDVD